MKKFINDPEAFVDQVLEGLLLAHPDQYRRVGPRSLVRADAPVPGKVGIVTGGGSGHFPLFLGYVGRGLADAVAVGNVFSSPSVGQIVDAARAVDGGAGCLFLYGNYGGDVLNFGMAADRLRRGGVRVEEFLASDDVASAPPEEASRRRGIAGIFFLYKVVGAAAEGGAGLDELLGVAAKASAGVRTMGVALSPCVIPSVGRPTFAIGEDEMEVGMGIHGEPGLVRVPLETADQVARRLVEPLLAELALGRGDEVAVLVNGLGATPREELYLLYRKAHRILEEAGVTVVRVFVGEFATSLEMAGASLSLMRLDDELKGLLLAPAHSHLVADLPA